jgi:hypothetical protein
MAAVLEKDERVKKDITICMSHLLVPTISAVMIVSNVPTGKKQCFVVTAP